MPRTLTVKRQAEVTWTPAEVAVMYRKTRKTVLDWCHAGHFSHGKSMGWRRLPGGDVCITEEGLAAFRRRFEVTTEPAAMDARG